MCEKVFEKDPRSLKYVPDWFVTDQKIRQVMKLIIGRHCLFDDLIKWRNGYEKRKAQKLKTKHELAPIAWHPSRWWDWCIPEDEKQEIEKNFLTTRYTEIKNVSIK